MGTVSHFPNQSAAGRPYLAATDLTDAQCQFILSLPSDGNYGIPCPDQGSIRASLIFMGYVGAGCSSRWGPVAARLTQRGQSLHKQLAQSQI